MATAVRAKDADYSQVSALLKTYCSGCHNESDSEADFSVGSYELIRSYRSEVAPLVVEGEPQQSRLFQLITGTAMPKMPPEDQPQPEPLEVELIRQWIFQGAKPAVGPEEAVDPKEAWATEPTIENVRPAAAEAQIVTSASAFRDQILALGGYSSIELLDTDSERIFHSIELPAGRVASLRLSPSGKTLVVGSGQAGVRGKISLIDTLTQRVSRSFDGHADSVYALAVSPDEKSLASGSYDRSIIIWDLATGTERLRLTGHNGTITDLDFHPDGELLASTSTDSTVKLWHVPTGNRLDTLGQPEGEMRTVRFSPDGRILFAAGADRQIRAWQIMSTRSVAINPLLEARYAHDKEILKISIVDHQTLVSSAVDGNTKAWTIPELRPLGTLATHGGNPVGICVSGNQSLMIVDLKGKTRELDLASLAGSRSSKDLQQPDPKPVADVLGSRTQSVIEDSLPSRAKHPATEHAAAEHPEKLDETEPNGTISTAMRIELPAQVSGLISSSTTDSQWSDVDVFQFQATAGETWIFEVDAARSQSALDSTIDILDANGQPVLQTRLQALRESYFTFRGKDSATSDDYRLHKWEDMELDEFLYANSEVTRLWRYPRGPDSGFKVYPGSGTRHTFFGTTPVAHALGDPAYIVRPLEEDEVALPNGLPIFPIYFANDDDSTRERGRDSLLTFQAPTSDAYFLRLRDARGFGGEDFKYLLTVRKPQPDYEVSLTGTDLSVPRGSGREWSVSVKRKDGMDRPIHIRLTGLPPGVLATDPLIIEEGQLSALGTIYVPKDAALMTEPVSIGLTATVPSWDAMSSHLPDDDALTQQLTETLQLKMVDATEPAIVLVENESQEIEILGLTIQPGQTISAVLKVQRNGLEGQISFGGDGAGRNLPHGAFVDNIGLSGLLITEGNNFRELSITAAPKVKPGRRQFHFRSETAGNPTSKPIWLNITE